MARGWKLAGVGRSGDSELGLAWDLAVEHARGTRSPPGALVGFGDAWSLELGDDGGSGRRGLTGAGRSMVSRGLWPTKTSAKRRRDYADAHRGVVVAGVAA